jgi:hypothetical protein
MNSGQRGSRSRCLGSTGRPCRGSPYRRPNRRPELRGTNRPCHLQGMHRSSHCTIPKHSRTYRKAPIRLVSSLQLDAYDLCCCHQTKRSHANRCRCQNNSTPIYSQRGKRVPTPPLSVDGKNTINTRWTSCDDVRVEHHEGQSTIPLERMFGMELQDRLSLGFI